MQGKQNGKIFSAPFFFLHSTAKRMSVTFFIADLQTQHFRLNLIFGSYRFSTKAYLT